MPSGLFIHPTEKVRLFSQEEMDSNSCFKVLYRVLWETISFIPGVWPRSISYFYTYQFDGAKQLQRRDLASQQMAAEESQQVVWEPRNSALNRFVENRGTSSQPGRLAAEEFRLE